MEQEAKRYLFLIAHLVTTSKALVTSSDALVPSSKMAIKWLSKSGASLAVPMLVLDSEHRTTGSGTELQNTPMRLVKGQEEERKFPRAASTDGTVVASTRVKILHNDQSSGALLCNLSPGLITVARILLETKQLALYNISLQ